MQKRLYFLFIVSFPIIVFGGIFLWAELAKQIDGVNFLPEVKIEDPENYEIIETAEGIIVRNEKAGLSFRAPENWTAEKAEVGIDQWIVNVNSPDLMADEKGFLIQGCGISAWIEYDETTANIIRGRIQDPEKFSQELSAGQYFSIKIDNSPASKMILERPEWGKGIYIKIPIEDRIYVFETRILPEEQKCLEYFNNFLENISLETILF